jgi:pimeloyl-ACP methyl ester carboxylesterase
MPHAAVNGIELYYETFGYPDDPPLLLIMGLGGHAVAWPEEFCEGFVDRGFFVIRFDNRDVGLSTMFEGEIDLLGTAAAVATGQPIAAPYRLADLAADAAGLLDHLDLEAAHVMGVSMGGMVAQTLAINHAERVLTLTSVMSTTGEAEVGQPSPEAMTLLLQVPDPGRDGAVANALKWSKVIGSPDLRDEDRVRELAGRQYDRNPRADGVGRQLLAILASGDRADGLRQLATPTLVIHGTADKLIAPSGGERTAELIPEARLELLEGMGHDLPVPLWATIIELVTRHASQAAAA